jgi:hypothetical protein
MFCGECGTQNPETNRFCKNCGKPLKNAGTGSAPGVASAAPVSTPAPAAAPDTVQQSPVFVGKKPARNWLAVLSFILSCASWLVVPVLLGFIAIILGVVAIYSAKKNQSKFPVTAAFAIIVGLLAIVINLFWLDIFPAPSAFPRMY